MLRSTCLQWNLVLWLIVNCSMLPSHVAGISVTQSVQIDADGGLNARVAKPVMRSDMNSTVPSSPPINKPLSRGAHPEQISPTIGSTAAFIATVAKRVFGSKSVSRDNRPDIRFFMDGECKTEVGGFYLPGAANILHDTCFPVQHRNYNEAVWFNKKVGDKEGKVLHMSMLWTCHENGDMNIVTSTNGQCVNHIDDSWSVHVKSRNLARLAAGRCISVMNEGQFQAEYVKMYNTDKVQEWPECVKDNVYVAMIIILASCFCFMFCCTAAYCAFVRHRWKQHNKKLGYGKGRGKGKEKGKGKGKGKGEEDEALLDASGKVGDGLLEALLAALKQPPFEGEDAEKDKKRYDRASELVKELMEKEETQGVIKAPKLNAILLKHMEKPKKEVADEIIKKAKTDDEGRITYGLLFQDEEFLKKMKFIASSE